jgi:hypothetical protein
MNLKTLTAGLGGLVALLLTMLVSLDVVHWTGPQQALVSAEALTLIGFVVAVYAHFRPETSPEPVAVAGSFTALVAATLSLLAGFGVWHMTTNQQDAVMAFVLSAVTFVAAFFARRVVAPLNVDGQPVIDGEVVQPAAPVPVAELATNVVVTKPKAKKAATRR